MNCDLAELLGIHIEDGCISVNERYSEYYLGGDLNEEIEYHDEWVSKLFNQEVMIPILGKEVVYKKHPKLGIYSFHIFDKKVVKYFRELGIKPGSKIDIKIPFEIKSNKKYVLIEIKSNKKYVLRFLRGLFDTDGNLYFDKNRSAKQPINNRPTIKLGTVSKELMYDVFGALTDLRLHPRMKKPYKGKRDKNYVYTVLLYRVKDIEFYIKNIGFKNPKHLTKWMMYKKYGICKPNTTLEQRKQIIQNRKSLKAV